MLKPEPPAEMKCCVCQASLDAAPAYGQRRTKSSFAARIVVPGPGLIQVCSAACAVKPPFATSVYTRQTGD